MQCINKKDLWLDGYGFVAVPCNKCLPCLMNKRADWSFRLEQENKVSKASAFVTLTYDEKHIRTDRSLCKRDLQLYLKRLRKKDEQIRIRYYAVGEYGTLGDRPHYHIILFNSCEEHIRNSWVDSKGNSIGIVHIGKVTVASIAYTTKYLVQPVGKLRHGYERPFATMSRAYGLGGHYLTDEMVKWHRENDANYTVHPGNIKGRLPRFYKEKIWYGVDRQMLGKRSLASSLEAQKLEQAYYEKHYGERADEVRLAALHAQLSRIKTKVKFSQTL